MSLSRDRRNLNHLKIKRYKSARCRRGPCISLKICKGSASLPENVIFGNQVFSHGRSSIPYYRKLTLHEIKVLEINAT